ncbi:MAG TPA: hypothetical protein VLB69_03005, partial [Rudaea sp.]|nr:hypothetical protein [Rudaea sp.]
MRDVLFVTIATRCARFILLLAWTVAILSPSRARADAFPDTVFFNGFDPCVGVQCFQVHCPAGQTTSVSGTVYAPNGTLPLPNVEVYVPNATLAAFTDGPNAPRCDQAPSGHPLVATLTDASGNFTLKNMPATTNVPVVLLAGKWRRQITVASVPQCTNTALDAADTRLPQNHTEGDIAHIAVATGSADAFECLIRKIGVADSEFSTSSGSGRIHLFAGTSGNATNHFDLTNGGATFASASTLWASSAALAAYDQVMLACDGSQNPGGTIPAAALNAMTNYANAGGRVYFAHWQNYWLQANVPWAALATWDNGLASFVSPITAQVSSNFPQAAIEYAWLTLVGASTTPGTLSI